MKEFEEIKLEDIIFLKLPNGKVDLSIKWKAQALSQVIANAISDWMNKEGYVKAIEDKGLEEIIDNTLTPYLPMPLPLPKYKPYIDKIRKGFKKLANAITSAGYKKITNRIHRELEEFTNCIHIKENSIDSDCIHCGFAWCLERIWYLEEKYIKKLDIEDQPEHCVLDGINNVKRPKPRKRKGRKDES